MVGEAEAQTRFRQKANVDPFRQAQADEFCIAQEALDTNESTVGREEEGSLSSHSEVNLLGRTGRSPGAVQLF